VNPFPVNIGYQLYFDCDHDGKCYFPVVRASNFSHIVTIEEEMSLTRQQTIPEHEAELMEQPSACCAYDDRFD